VETGSTGPWTALCEHRPLPETSGPRRLNAPTPTLATVAEGNPRHDGVLRARLLRPQGVTRLVVLNFFESASDAVYVGPSRERTANGRRSSAGQHRVHSCDRRKGLGGATSARPGVQGSPQREPALPRKQLEAEYARRKVESSFWSGLVAAQCGRRGQLSRANGTPEELRRLARPCVLS